MLLYFYSKFNDLKSREELKHFNLKKKFLPSLFFENFGF